MNDRITHQNVKAQVVALSRLAEGRGLLPEGGLLALQKGSPANGIPWRLTGRERGSGGLIELSFLPERGFLGNSAKDAYTRLSYTVAALKAFPQTVRVVEQ
jgi:hypothetical protein